MIAAIIAVMIAGQSAAAGGWYLLVPPLSKYDASKEFLDGYQVLVSEPLSKWRHHSSWDDAESCEAVKASQTRLQHRVYVKASVEYRGLLGTKTDPLALKTQRWITCRRAVE